MPEEFSKEKTYRESTIISPPVSVWICVQESACAKYMHIYCMCAHTHFHFLCVCEGTHVVQSKQANVPVPHSGECPTLCANASLWLWINNSECWHSWVEPLLFMVGIGTDRWLLLILRTSRHSPPPRNQAVFNTFMSVSILCPLSSTPLYSALLTPLLLCPCSPDLCPLHLWASLSLPLSLYRLYLSPVSLCCAVSISRSHYEFLIQIRFLGTGFFLNFEAQKWWDQFTVRKCYVTEKDIQLGQKCSPNILLLLENNEHQVQLHSAYFIIFSAKACQLINSISANVSSSLSLKGRIAEQKWVLSFPGHQIWATVYPCVWSGRSPNTGWTWQKKVQFFFYLSLCPLSGKQVCLCLPSF